MGRGVKGRSLKKKKIVSRPLGGGGEGSANYQNLSHVQMTILILSVS